MIAIGEVAKNLGAHPRSVLCLDTCDLLDIVRGVGQGNLHHARSAKKLLAILGGDPGRVQLVVTSLVQHEWDQNIEAVRGEAINQIARIDNLIDQFVEVCRFHDPSYNDPGTRFTPRPLVEASKDMAEKLLGHAIVLERDDECVERALGRVMEHRRPSHNNQIKDSIHWEHYLELSRRLVAAGHPSDRLFASANKKDFGREPGPDLVEKPTKKYGKLHADLRSEAEMAGLTFVGDLVETMKYLGLS